MSGQNRQIIQNVFLNHIPGMIMTHFWLLKHHVSRQLTHKYLNSGWLENIARGVFVRAGDKPSWAGIVEALQNQLKLSIHLGGRTALELQGHGHYGRFIENIDLFGDTKTKLPPWVKEYTFDHYDFQYVRTGLFLDDLGIEPITIESFTLQIASLERAMLEMLAFVPQKYSYDEAAQLMSSLKTLRSKQVQNLLTHCQSVKAKRLFLHLAHLCQHPWLKKIDCSQMSLGHGVRKLPGGHILDKTYQLYVPDNPFSEGQ